MFQNSLLLSFITLGTAIAVEKTSGVTNQSQLLNTTNGSILQTSSPIAIAANSVTQTATTIAQQLAQKLMEQVKPTISLPSGMLVKVMVNQDITMPSYTRLVNNIN